ncbi:MAG TPA: long-chain fatty acid--CoA ligase [Clostridia bacterium]|nr:long-chain fatty acid--CoA ligase [Clostridia bacterium]
MQVKKSDLPWLYNYDSGVPHSMDYPEKPVVDLVKRHINNSPGRTAVLFFGKKISYGELGKAIDAFSFSLKKMGVKRGSKVALLLPNCPQYIIAYYAILSLGAVVVPVNPLNTEREMIHIMNDAEVTIAVSINLLGPRIQKVREQSGIKEIIYTSLADYLPFPLNILFPFTQKVSPEAKEAVAKGLKFKDMLGDIPLGSKIALAKPVDVHKDLAVLIYTSGTTGKPKGVMLSNYALVVNASHAKAWGMITEDDSMLAVLPIFHGFGMSVCMNAVLISGGVTVLLPRYQPEELLKTVQKYKPTFFAGVPTMYIGLINLPNFKKYDLSSLRGCFVGAAALPQEVKNRFEKMTGSRLMEGYGLTEAVTAKSANPFKGINKTGSIGLPFPDTIMKIVDTETGKTQLPPGEIGEIILKSPDMMLGYYNNQEDTDRTIRNGWLFTGDLGWMDKQGYFYIVERKKDLIITGGFNVYPKEVEDVLYSHPAVAEACVVGIPDDYRGEAVKAFVVLREGKEATGDELKAFCKEQLTPYKAPRGIEIRNDLPKSAIGKILRKELREE